MKRKIASRKLKRTCICCDKSFIKGEVYYLKREVLEEIEGLIAYEYIICSKCKYKNERQKERYKKFIESGKCKHLIIDEVWIRMVGEDFIKEPSHTECSICGEVI